MVALGACILILAGCGGAQNQVSPARIPQAILRETRPIGRGPRFHPPLDGPIVGSCRDRLGQRYGVHVEVFGANRVVILPAGIGTRLPRRLFAGRIVAAGCFGALVTLEPTGLVLIRPGATVRIADLFRAWGQTLSDHQVASFGAGPGRQVRVYVNGQRRPGPPGTVPLRRHAEIVLEAGPYVPPHRFYTFPPGS